MARRGRPTVDDDALLKKVAAKLAKNPKRSPRSAITQSLLEPSDSNIRRLQRKWRKNGEVYLKAAQEALQEQSPVSYRTVRRNLPALNFPSHNLDQIFQASQRVQNMLEGGAMGRAIEQFSRVEKAIDAVYPRQVRELLEQQARVERLIGLKS